MSDDKPNKQLHLLQRYLKEDPIFDTAQDLYDENRRLKELVEAVNKYRKSRLITDRKAMFELAKELEDE